MKGHRETAILWLACDQTPSLASWSLREKTWRSIAFYYDTGGLGQGHRAGSDDVMRLDTVRKGSNRMGDDDRHRYNDQVLTGGPFRPLLNPRAQEWKMQTLSNGAVSHIRNQTPWDTNTHTFMDSHIHKNQHNAQPLLYVQSEINEYRRDQAWTSMWIPYAWRLSEERKAYGG